MEKLNDCQKIAEALATIQSICYVDEKTARLLLEGASGSIERAVDIHFNRKLASHESSKSPGKGAKRHHSTLHSFLGLPTLKENGSKQRKIDSFFSNTRASSQSQAENSSQYDVDAPLNVEKKVKTDARVPQNHVPDADSPLRLGDHNGTSHQPEDLALDTESEGCAASVPKPAQQSRTSNKISSPTSADGSDLDEAEIATNSLPYGVLTSRFAEMTSTTKRNAKIQLLVDIFEDAIKFVGGVHMREDREEDAYTLTCVVDLILGKLSVTPTSIPKENITLQVSGSAVSTAVQSVTGASRAQMRDEYRRTGDLGDVAAKFFVRTSVRSFFGTTKQTQNARSVYDVHSLLQKIATIPSGKGSQAARQNLLLRALRGCRDKEEIRFLVRTLLGNMRLGATLRTIIVALAKALEKFTDKTLDADETLQNTFNVCPRILNISKALLEGGVSRASEVCVISVGNPVQPMLANPAHSLEEVKKFMGSETAVAEWKYDGVRCQAHFDGNKVTLYSRHLVVTTLQYPDAVSHLLNAKRDNVTSFICDAEIVAAAPCEDAPDGYRLLPFQDLATRRSTNEEKDEATVPIRIYCYDLMYLNGNSLLKEPLSKRQELLKAHFATTTGFGFAASVELTTYDEELLRSSLHESVDGGVEGLMIKLKEKGYESGLRSRFWLKLKRDYVRGSADTIDVVPIGAWHGSGRKAQAGFLSPVLLAVYDEHEDCFRSISRCMTFTDSMYRASKEFYFSGVPYPLHVGVSSHEGAVTGDESQVDAKNKEDTSSVQAVDDEDQGMSDEESSSEEDRVNCYSSRPSTAVYITGENPTIWFKPLEVWEVSFADLTLSRVHTAAAGIVDDDQGRGVALRFPRFLRRRPDKSIRMATTCTQVAELFAKQSKILLKNK